MGLFNDWYIWLSQWSAIISQPFSTVYHQTETPLIAALFLGLTASLAPCQLSTNAGAMAYIINRVEKTRSTTLEVAAFVLGKAVVYILFGLLAFWVGDQIRNSLIPLFVIMRQLLGPIFLLVGMFMLGWVRLPGGVGMKISNLLKNKADQLGGARGTFLLGIAFSLGWCPTMVWLFFGLLVPLMIAEPSGFLLPPVFAVGTALPVIFIMAMAFVFGMDKTVIKKSRRFGQIIMKVAGVIFVLIGLNDIFAYWFLG
jgi:cytochrome c-type biogenesis protein